MAKSWTAEEEKLALAYLKECGQTATDVEWMREAIQLDHTRAAFAIETVYLDGLRALAIVRGEEPGRPEILAKVRSQVNA